MRAATLILPGQLEYESWRMQVRGLLERRISPANVEWADPFDAAHLWRSEQSPTPPEQSPAVDVELDLRVPREFPVLARSVLCHRSSEKWNLLYRMLWRLTVERQRGLLENALDDDVFAANALAKSVKRDVHKMRAFVRFCRVEDEAAGEHYVAFHKPEHPILRIAAPFFVRRFGVMNWTILTPFESATWLGGELTFGPPASRDQAPRPDSLEDFWKTYYVSTFNPARANRRAMLKEMPRKYWSTLPEAALIDDLLANAPGRTESMIGRTIGDSGAAAFIPDVREHPAPRALTVLSNAARACRGCELYREASCTVFGEGAHDARLMLVGEQPGDQEDLAGRVFVGPAGQVLDRALADAGIERHACYITNAVKHFKWTPAPRGKRRIHAKPSVADIRACKPWLESEIAVIRPTVLVLLGSTAGQAVMGAGFRVTQSRGAVFRDSPIAPAIVPTFHPSAILRAADEATSRRQYDLLVADLKTASALCGV